LQRLGEDPVSKIKIQTYHHTRLLDKIYLGFSLSPLMDIFLAFGFINDIRDNGLAR